MAHAAWVLEHVTHALSLLSMCTSWRGLVTWCWLVLWGFFKDGSWLLLYVDDQLIIGPDLDILLEVIACLGTPFTLTDMGSAKFYLGVDNNITPGKVALPQKRMQAGHDTSCLNASWPGSKVADWAGVETSGANHSAGGAGAGTSGANHSAGAAGAGTSGANHSTEVGAGGADAR